MASKLLALFGNPHDMVWEQRVEELKDYATRSHLLCGDGCHAGNHRSELRSDGTGLHCLLAEYSI